MVVYTLSRKFSPIQQKRRNKILSATREIISNKGSDDFNMLDVAKKAGISRATLYRYYASREDLINDMALDWGLSLMERIQKNIPLGNTVGERITAVFANVFEEAQRYPNLISATLNVIISPNFAAFESHVDVEQLLPSLINMVINEDEVENPEFVLGTLGRLTLANLLYLSSGRCEIQEAVDNMAYASRLLYGDNLWNRSVPT